MSIQVVTIMDVVLPAEQVDFAWLLRDGDTIHWCKDVPRGADEFETWLEQWHREHNPQLFAFAVTSAGEQLCTKD